MFEVNGVYANRKGRYTVLEINPPKMRVRFEDGSEANLNMNLQARIWENIRGEEEIKAQSRRPRRRKNLNTQHFIKTVKLPIPEEIAFPGWQEKVILVPEKFLETVKKGDRIIFMAIEAKTFFAVATITSDPFTAAPKDYFYTLDEESVQFFSIDLDASVLSLAQGAYIDAIELESIPNLSRLRLKPEAFLKINEDDFEIIAEALTEALEEMDEDDEDELEYDEDDDI